MALDRFLILAWLALAPFAVLAQAPHTHQHSFGNAQQWAHYFDDPARDSVPRSQTGLRGLPRGTYRLAASAEAKHGC